MSDDFETSAAKFEELNVPPPALEHGGYEVVRAAIVEGNLAVSLRRAFDDPEVWGILLADVTRHIGRLYALEAAMREDQVIEKIWATFEAEMERPTDLGTTSAVS
jgi:Domain of unknown function (DUF5076)